MTEHTPSRRPKKITDSEILEALDAVPFGEALPSDGPCGVVYANLVEACYSALFFREETPYILYVDHDDVITGLDYDNYSWFVENFESTVHLNLLIKDGGDWYLVKVIMDYDSEKSAKIFDAIKVDKTLNFYFLAIAHGGLTKEKFMSFTIPDKILDQIEF